MLSPLREARALTTEEHDLARRTVLSARAEALVLTSVNGVRGLVALAGVHRGGSVRELIGSARVLALGPATETALRQAEVDPQDWNPRGEHPASAEGLSSGWPEELSAPGTRVLVAHGMPHRPELAERLRARGLEVIETEVYVMVDHPAAEPLEALTAAALTASADQDDAPEDAAGRDAAPVLDHRATARVLQEGGGVVVVATSPALLRTLASLGPLPERIVCIGPSTAAAAEELGHIPVVSADTGPEALAAAADHLIERM